MRPDLGHCGHVLIVSASLGAGQLMSGSALSAPARGVPQAASGFPILVALLPAEACHLRIRVAQHACVSLCVMLYELRMAT